MAIALVALSAGAQAAPSYFGPTGNIMTPDALTTPMSGFDVAYHRFFSDNSDLNVVHANIGLSRNIEVGASWFDPEDGDADLALNGKWRFVEESATRPAVAVGVLDATGDALSKDASVYILVSKNLTQYAESVIERESKPLRGTIGVGGGAFDGLFASLNWTFAPKVSIMLEFVKLDKQVKLGDQSVLNGGVRFALSPELRLDGALVDFNDAALGLSFNRRF